MGFKEPTVFIVGAGAHVDYGMPTGVGLINDLELWCYGGQPDAHRHRELLVECLHQLCPPTSSHARLCDGTEVYYDGFERGIKTLVRRLIGSHHQSIDSILAQVDADEAKFGRWIIAALLLHYTMRAITLPRRDGWHLWLANQCGPRPEGTGDRHGAWDFRNVTVITFNYDTLFEHHMRTLIRNWGRQDPDLSVLPEPVHVYGKLSVPDVWDDEHRRYVYRKSPQDIVQSGKDLRIADGRTKDAETQGRIFNAISGARQVVFLGFAFDAANMRRLGFGSESRDLESALYSNEARIFATAYDQDARMQDAAAQMTGMEGWSSIEWGNSKESCSRCLHRWDIK